MHSHPLFVSVWEFPVFPGVSYVCKGLRCLFFFFLICLDEAREKEVSQPCMKPQVSVRPAWSVAHLNLPGSVGAVSLYDSFASFSYTWA